jgi:hypothetical protein
MRRSAKPLSWRLDWTRQKRRAHPAIATPAAALLILYHRGAACWAHKHSYPCARAHSHTHTATQSHTHRITHLPSAHVVLCSDATHSSSLTVETALYPPAPLWPPPPSPGRQSRAPVHQAIALSPAEPRWAASLCARGAPRPRCSLSRPNSSFTATTVLQYRESTCA